MPQDASYVRASNDVRLTAAAAALAFEVRQVADGRAAVFNSQNGVSAGGPLRLKTDGVWTCPKATGFVALAGGRAYWDHSANQVTYRKVNDRDFYLGRFSEDAASADTTCSVNLGIDPPYDLDLARDPFGSAPVGTPAAGGFGYPARLGGGAVLELDATNEAQKVDLLSVDGFSPAANAVVEFAFRVLSDGAGGAPDLSIGVANGTHGTDADAIAEHLFLHLDGNATDLKLQSKDGTTTVAATDTTLDYAEGSAVANRVEVWLDTRNPADVQCYVNGALALGSTAFDLSHAAGPLFLLAHLEKTAAANTYKVALDWFRARYAEQ